MIKIGKDYALKSDGVCVAICKRHESKKTGKVKYERRWFYGNYTQALHGLIDHEINHPEVKKLEFVVGKIEQLKSDISERLDEIVKKTNERKLRIINNDKTSNIADPPKTKKRKGKRKETLSKAKPEPKKKKSKPVRKKKVKETIADTRKKQK